MAMIAQWMKGRRDARTIRRWRAEGNGSPPPHVLKQQVVRGYGDKFGLPTLVETGTFKGEMVEAMAPYFREVHSIELGRELYEEARQRFASLKHVHLYHGDSAVALPEVLRVLSGPALFWLDGHYSAGITARGAKDTPIMEELAAIYRHHAIGHVILIDDARLFNGTGDYPDMETLRQQVNGWSPGVLIEVSDDIIRMRPPRPPA